MSSENVEVVRRSHAAFAKGGAEATYPYLSPDVLIHPFPEWPHAREYRGHEGFRTVMAEWADNFDDFTMEPSELREIEGGVLWLGEIAARIKGTGVPIRQPLGSVYSRFQDGRIGEIHTFVTWQETLALIGETE